MAEQRPNPDKLLEQAQAEARQETRGKLKIYLGAAPGVGKTHEMLHDADTCTLKMEKGNNVEETNKKMIVSAANKIVKANSLGVF
jgi:K+-sensing histidine kinase KdpD